MYNNIHDINDTGRSKGVQQHTKRYITPKHNTGRSKGVQQHTKRYITPNLSYTQVYNNILNITTYIMLEDLKVYNNIQNDILHQNIILEDLKVYNNIQNDILEDLLHQNITSI